MHKAVGWQDGLGIFCSLTCLTAGVLVAMAVSKPIIEDGHRATVLEEFKQQVFASYGIELTDEQALYLNPPFWPLSSDEQQIVLGEAAEVTYHSQLITVLLGWNGTELELVDTTGQPLSIDSLDNEETENEPTTDEEAPIGEVPTEENSEDDTLAPAN